MKIINGDIPGLLIMEPLVFRDERGSFMETYHRDLLASMGFFEVFVQDNESISARGVVRALHFQRPPMDQGKLVRVVKGSVMDVAVDIRHGSPWYGKHQKVLLSGGNKRMFWLPPGFAHGFAALEDETIVNYKCTKPYSREHEDSIRWDDPDLGVDWGVENPVVSARDRDARLFSEHEVQFYYRP